MEENDEYYVKNIKRSMEIAEQASEAIDGSIDVDEWSRVVFDKLARPEYHLESDKKKGIPIPK